MKIKGVMACFLILILGIAVNLPAVETWEIDRVRGKEVLEEGDFHVIDSFVWQGVQELVQTSDLTTTAKIYALILSRCATSVAGGSVQYSDSFFEAAHKHIASGLEKASTLTPEKRRSNIIMNLLILVDGLGEPGLADLALAKLKDGNMAIRYWAVHCVTNAASTAKLNSSELKLAMGITEQLQQIVEDSSPEILGLMAEFAANVEIQQGQNLLLQTANSRINKYANWTVTYELADNVILNSLYSKLSKGLNPEAARRFAQLYSCMIQRYVRGRDILNGTQKEQLASVLVNIEKSCVSAILGAPQTAIKRAVENNDMTALLLEHSRLLGDSTRQGQLAEKLNFDYGKDADGNTSIEPFNLPAPPKTTD